MPVEVLSLSELAQHCEQAGADLHGGSYQEPLRTCLVLIKADVKDNFSGGHGPDGEGWAPLAFARPRGGDKPLRDTGLLMASITSTGGQGHVEQLTDRDLVVGTNLGRAAIHQYGGTITPKKGKYLAIPLTKEAQRAGSPSNFAGDLVPIFGAKGGVLIEKKAKGRGKKQRVEEVAQFALVKSVVIPARPYLGFGQQLLGKIVSVFEAWLEKNILKRL